MKTISRLAVSALFLASFSAPLFASAQEITCSPPCQQGFTCDSLRGVCVPSSTGGGINLSVITPYSSGIINLINGILVPVLMAIAFITFLWGVYKYFIQGASSDTERETGRQFVLWGIIGFVVILSVWGLVAIVTNFFSLQTGGAAPKPPTF